MVIHNQSSRHEKALKLWSNVNVLIFLPIAYFHVRSGKIYSLTFGDDHVVSMLSLRHHFDDRSHDDLTPGF
jgi:hypothetical protein